MSENDVEALQRLVERLNSGELARVVEQLAPDFQYDITGTDSPLSGVYTRDQMPSLMEEFLGGWESVRYEPDEFIDAGDRVVMRFRTRFRGRQGIELETLASWVVTFRQGEVTGIRLYQAHADALQAAGVVTSHPNPIARGARRLRQLVRRAT